MFFALVLIALIPSLGVLYFILQRDRLDTAHRKLLFKTAFWGMLAFPIVFIVHYFLQKYFNIDLNTYAAEQAHGLFDIQGDIKTIFSNFFSGGIVLSLFLSILGIAFVEEYAKKIIIQKVDWNKKAFNRIIDGIEFSVAAALGFAFIENIVYFYLIQDSFLDISLILPALVLRTTISTIVHILASGVFGYYYGKAKFVGHTKKLHKKHTRKTHHFHAHKGLSIHLKRIKHFFTGKNLHDIYEDHFHQDLLIAEGLVIATVLHGLFSFFITMGIGYLIIPILALEYAMIAHEFHVHQNFKKQK